MHLGQGISHFIPLREPPASPKSSGLKRRQRIETNSLLLVIKYQLALVCIPPEKGG
jgi:hypothetical protein